MKKEGYVKWFSELNNKDVAVAGGKGASLAEMYNHKFPIPPGFIVSAQAYEHFIKENGLNTIIKTIIERLDVENTKELADKSQQIREMIETANMPADMGEEILESYSLLGSDENYSKHGNALEILSKAEEMPFVAVRSSATTEDL